MHRLQVGEKREQIRLASEIGVIEERLATADGGRHRRRPVEQRRAELAEDRRRRPPGLAFMSERALRGLGRRGVSAPHRPLDEGRQTPGPCEAVSIVDSFEDRHRPARKLEDAVGVSSGPAEEADVLELEPGAELEAALAAAGAAACGLGENALGPPEVAGAAQGDAELAHQLEPEGIVFAEKRAARPRRLTAAGASPRRHALSPAAPRRKPAAPRAALRDRRQDRGRRDSVPPARDGVPPARPVPAPIKSATRSCSSARSDLGSDA